MADAKVSFPDDVSLQDLPQLFAEFSRTTEELVATHNALRTQVRVLKRELAEKSRRLERKKRLEALGRVAAGVAHEFRNPLGSIRLTVDALLSSAPVPAARERLEHVLRALNHLDRIVSDLLTFTRIGVLERTPVVVAELVEYALSLACPERGSQARVVITAGPPDLCVLADRHAMTQVLVNLLTNAREALPEAEGRIGVWWGDRDGRRWIEVADTGPGVPEGEEERIFHPFYTLRDTGTGLGLAIAHSRVEAHEGEIAVARDAWGGGRDWSGARFRITLPAAPGTAGA